MENDSTKPTITPAEQQFHETAQRNALGGYIGCEGPECWALIQEISSNNIGHKLQSPSRENGWR